MVSQETGGRGAGAQETGLVTRHTHCHATLTDASYLQTIVLLHIPALSAKRKDTYLQNALHSVYFISVSSLNA